MATGLQIFKIFLHIFIPCFFIITLVINYMSSQPSSIFITTTGNVSDTYNTIITPAGWAFTIWAFIYVFQLCISVYIVCTLFVKVNGTRLYEYENVFPIPFLVVYLLNLVFNLSWIFIFDRSIRNTTLLALACFILILVSVLLYISIGIISYNMKKARENGFYKGKCAMYVVDVIFLQNGLGIYAGWTTVAQCLNIAISLQYYSGVDAVLSSVAALSVLLVLHVGYTVLDLTLLDAYTRYLLIPYGVVAYAIGAAINKNYTKWEFAKCLVIIEVVAVVVVVIKLVYMIVRGVLGKCDSTVQDSTEKLMM